jgi:class 3 adenylate cyclase/tetratricopeptide (TPR) repeat protein
MAARDERKPVTVLYADLAGSTELATRHDPEHLRSLLAAFFDEMRQQIEAFGGTVEKYAGDAVMAVFGVPQVHEDDAERAVRAAFAMQESLAQLNPMFEQEYDVQLVLRLGVATGEAVAASRTVSELMVTGEVPNLAARLQAAGEGITVSEATRRLLGPRLEAEPLEALSLKGFPGPVTAYRARGLRAIERPDAAVTGLSSPVIGRDREQEVLAACLEDLRRGRGQVVFIVGEAGIGKTRLKIEQREHLPEGVRWLEGRCQSYTQSTSYALIVQILRAALGLGLAEAPAIARARLRAALRDLGGGLAEQSQGALAHLLGIDLGPGHARAEPSDPRALQSQLVLATRAFLQGLAEHGPIIVAVEDLHWADTVSVDLLTLLLELTDFQPIMFLVTSRPETEGDIWTFRLHAERNLGHRLTELRLAPLGVEASQRLADNLLRVSDLPAGIRDRILQRSEGNPFFLEEILRGLIEEGVLHREADRWRIGTAPERWAIPTTLLGVIAARIDRLPGPAKALLQRAAVIGRFFGYRAVRELSDEPAELDQALAHLLRAELIRESAALPERQYLFKHALTQEAAEASLLTEQRHELHGRIARYLESTLGEGAAEHAALLAHHWYHAGQWEQALEHTLAAADRARRLHDRPAAIGHYWRALEIVDRLPLTEPRQQQHADAALALVRLPGFARDEAMVRRGIDHLDRAIESAARRGDVGRLVRMQASKGFIVGTEVLLKEALVRAEDLGDPLTLAWAVERYGQYLGQRGRWDETLVQARRAIAIYAEQGASYQQAMNVRGGGRCYSARGGRLDDSLRYAAQFREMAADLGEAPLLAWRAMEAEPYVYKGAWVEAIRVAEESLPIAWQIGETNVILFASAWLGLAHLKVGNPAEARRVVDGAIEYGQTSRDSTPFALTYLTIAAALTRLAEGAAEAALEQARRALDYADRSRFPLEQGAAQRALGQAYAATGNRSGADPAFRASLAILDNICCRPEVGQTLLAYGRFRLDEDPAEGRVLIEGSCAVFEEIGADGWLGEARSALSMLSS